MCSDITDDAGERADAQAWMIWDRHVMFAVLRRCEAHVAPRLTRDRVAVLAECAREVTPR